MATSMFCADDWGLSPGVNAGILTLARTGRLRSVSCMAGGAALVDGLDELLKHRGRVEFALHFNLTYGAPLGSPGLVRALVDPHSGNFLSLRQLLFRCFLRPPRPESVAAEFEAQLSLLRDLGIPVTAVNGHHHVHLLPSVYSAIRKIMSERGLEKLRVMTDVQHLPSFLQSWFFRNFQFKRSHGLRPEECHYLTLGNQRSISAVEKKIRRSGELPLLVHPALYDDFDEKGVRDSLRKERISQLRMILESET